MRRPLARIEAGQHKEPEEEYRQAERGADELGSRSIHGGRISDVARLDRPTTTQTYRFADKA